MDFSDVLGIVFWISVILYGLAFFKGTRQSNKFQENEIKHGYKCTYEDFDTYMEFRKHHRICSDIKNTCVLVNEEYSSGIKGFAFLNRYPDINSQEVKDYFIRKNQGR